MSAEFLKPPARKRIREIQMPPGTGFDAMGRPIPAYRRQAAYDLLRQWGVGQDRAHAVVGGMAEALERDKPYEAMKIGMQGCDLTGTYRLMAVLLCEPKPRIRVPAGRRS